MTDETLESRVFQRKYGTEFPGKILCAIYDLVVPSSRVKIFYYGELETPVSMATEFLLKFIASRVNTYDDLERTLGFPRRLLFATLTDEIDAGRILLNTTTNEYVLSAHGQEVLRSLAEARPVRESFNALFNRATRGLLPSDTTTVLKDKDLGADDVQLITPSSGRPPTRAEISIQDASEVLTAMQQTRKGKIRVTEIVNSQVRAKGNVKAKLLVWLNTNGESDFVVDYEGIRRPGIERVIHESDGLSSLGIQPAAIQEAEEVQVAEALGVAVRNLESLVASETQNQHALSETRPMPDGGSVYPAEHRLILERALANSRERLLIISPWINRWVVTDEFIKQLRKLLLEGVTITIAWGFDDPTGRHSGQKSNPTVVKKLFKLHTEFESDFSFLKMDQSHSKVLISDGLYVCTSHNWLSYSGTSPRAEWGEKRTDPDVVEERYLEHINFLQAYGHPMTEDDIPQSNHPSR